MYLKNELWKWVKNDISLPLLVAFVLLASSKYIEVYLLKDINLVYFIGLFIFFMSTYSLIIPETRVYGSRLKKIAAQRILRTNRKMNNLLD